MNILTLTINPAIDKSSAVSTVTPDKKLRCDKPVYEPGGGGINVTKALKEMGEDSLALFLAGGPTGALLDHLMQQSGVSYRLLETQEWTRENLLVIDKTTGQEYKFIMPGPGIREEEWKLIFKELNQFQPAPAYLIASGSLPEGVPVDFYGQLAEWSKQKGVRLIVDTFGIALTKALEKGVFLIKPNLRELAALSGKESITAEEEIKAARDLIGRGACEIVVVSLGARGALMVSRQHTEYVVPPTVRQKSTVGAGDSMVAGMVYALHQNWPLFDVIKYGVAAGTAATMTSGSELCKKEDIGWIFKWLKQKN